MNIESFWIDILLFISYLGVLFVVFLSVSFPIIFWRKNIKNFSKLMLSIIMLSVLFLASYVFSSDEITNPTYTTSYGNPPTNLYKRIGGGIITMYVLCLTAFIVIIYSEAKRVFIN